MGGKITSGYKMSRVGSDIAELNKALTEDEIILETDNAYWICVQARELQRSALQYKETVEEFFRVIKNARDAGMKSQNDLMKVQVQLNQADLQLNRAENGVRLSRMNLCTILGLDLQSEIALSETFTESHIEINPNATIFSRPEYAMLDKQIELKRYEKQYVRSDFLPQIGIMGSYGYIHGAKFNNEQIFGNKPSFSAMVSVKIPLFSWGEGSKKVRAVEREIQMAQLQRDDLGQKMELELQQAISSYNETVLEVRLTQQALEQSEENMRISRDHYDAGMETISDYLEAQTIWRNAQAEHITAKTKLEIRKTEYLKASGNI
jgi:outer membrane protein TolC